MYTLKSKNPTPFYIPLPGRTLSFPKKGAECVVSDEEYKDGSVQGRLRYRQVGATYSDEEFTTPQTEQLAKYERRQKSKQRNLRRAAGEVL